MGRLLISIGIFIVILGVFWQFGERLGLGRLPGDITLRKENYAVHIPIVTCLLLSAGFSLLMWLVGWLRR